MEVIGVLGLAPPAALRAALLAVLSSVFHLLVAALAGCAALARLAVIAVHVLVTVLLDAIAALLERQSFSDVSP